MNTDYITDHGSYQPCHDAREVIMCSAA